MFSAWWLAKTGDDPASREPIRLSHPDSRSLFEQAQQGIDPMVVRDQGLGINCFHTISGLSNKRRTSL
jgi:hypothetical protein